MIGEQGMSMDTHLRRCGFQRFGRKLVEAYGGEEVRFRGRNVGWGRNWPISAASRQGRPALTGRRGQREVGKSVD